MTFSSAFYVWKGNKHAIFLAAITGGLADLGYFLFMDLGGYVKFMPGTVMTLVSSLVSMRILNPANPFLNHMGFSD